MRQYVESHRGDVIGYDVVSPAQQRQCPCGRDETERGARRRAVGQVAGKLGHPELGGRAGCQHHPHGVVGDRVVDEHLRGVFLQLHQGPRVQHTLGRRRRHAHASDDFELLDAAWIRYVDLHQEAVALRLRKRVHAFGLDRVLRGQHQERRGQSMGDAAEGDLLLGHDLQQCRLHLRGCPVDLVGEDEVREDGAQLDVEGFPGLAVHPRTDDVGHDQIAGELDTRERSADHRRQCLDGQGLGHSGYALQQTVPAGEQGHQHALDHVILADDHFLDLEEGAFKMIGIGDRVRVGQALPALVGVGWEGTGAVRGGRGRWSLPFVHGLSLAADAGNRDLKRGWSASSNNDLREI